MKTSNGITRDCTYDPETYSLYKIYDSFIYKRFFVVFEQDEFSEKYVARYSYRGFFRGKEFRTGILRDTIGETAVDAKRQIDEICRSGKIPNFRR